MNSIPSPIVGRIRTEVLDVTPSMARNWLSNKHPRQGDRYSDAVSRSYAAQMQAGTWDQPHPQGIIISSDGQLLDGQHRLEAVCMFGRSVRFLVITGVDASVYKHIDSGFIRSLGFRSNRPKDDMAIYMCLYNLCTYSVAKIRPTVEHIDLCASFIGPTLESFYARTSKIRKSRINPAYTRTAAILRVMERPDSGDEVCAAYNAYLKGDLHSAPRSMSALYRRMTDQYNPGLNIFGLAWKAFDPDRFDANQLKIANIGEEVKGIQKTILLPLMNSLRELTPL